MDSLDEYIGVGWENEPSRRTPVNAYNLGIMEDGIKRLFAYLIAGGGIGPGTNGREIELRNSGEYIQWRYSGEEDWTNLVSLADLKGEKGDDYVLTDEDIEEIASKVKVATSADKITYDDTETKLGAENVQDAIGNLSEQKVDKQDGYSMVSDSEKQAWNNKSDFSGSYNDLTDKPEIPEGADLTGYATEDYVKDYAQPKGNYLTEHQDLSGYALKEEIPTVPEKLPNPNPLTFTGAVTGSYDGSEAVNIDIPTGGSEDNWELINTITVDEDGVKSVVINNDIEGNDISLKKLYVIIENTTPQATYLVLKLNNLHWMEQFGTDSLSNGNVSAYNPIRFVFEIIATDFYRFYNPNSKALLLRRTGERAINGGKQSKIENITNVVIEWGTPIEINKDTIVTLWGVRA